MKDPKCKCSDLKSEHRKVLFSRTSCNVCPCNEFMEHDSPTRFQTVYMIIAMGAIFYALFLVSLVLYVVNEFPEERLDEPLDYTLRDFIHFDVTMFIGFAVIIIIMVFIPVIVDWFKARKRRNFNEGI